jgi:hypothetical protein
MSRLERLMPAFELPTPPPAPSAPPLLDMPAPTYDWALPAVAYDTPARPKGGAGLPAAASATAVAVAPPPIAEPWTAPDPAIAARAVEARPRLLVTDPVLESPPVEVAIPVVPPSPASVVQPAAPVAAVAPPAPALFSRPEPQPEPEREQAPAAPATTPMRGRFGSADPMETADDLPAPPAAVPWWRSARAVAAMAALVLLQGGLLAWQFTRPTEALTGEGELVVQSRPEGARVTIDDEDRGVTPLTVRVSPGTHVLQVRVGAAEPRVIPLMIRAGTQTAQYVELQGVSSTGVLEVRSEPSPARVTIDGQARGSTPLTLRDITPGDYQVVLERAGWKSTQVVHIEPGTIAQLVVPIR